MPFASVAEITFARPSNTTPYSPGDVVGRADAVTAANAGSALLDLAGINSSYCAFVQSIQLIINATSVPSGMAGFRVHLYNAPPTAILDNAQYAFVAADVPMWQDTFDLGTPVARGSLLRVQQSYQGGIIKLVPEAPRLIAVLETSRDFTPASGTQFTLRVKLMEAES